MSENESRALELAQAEAARAVAAGRKLVEIIERVGGFLRPADQIALNCAKADLCEPIVRKTWVDR